MKDRLNAFVHWMKVNGPVALIFLLANLASYVFAGWAGVISATSSLVLLLVIILLLAKLQAYYTRIPQGATVYINAGDSVKAVLPNIGGFRMSNDSDLDGRHWLIAEKDAEKQLSSLFYNSLPGTRWFQKWLWQTFGVKFISFFWPQVYVHHFDIRKGGRRRMESPSELKEDAPLRSRVVDSPGTTIVDSLLFLAPRPVYVEGVELPGDNAKINFLFLAVFRQVIPTLPVYYFRGDFYTMLDAAIEATVMDVLATHRVAVYKQEGPKKGRFASVYYQVPADASKKTDYEDTYERSPLTYAHWLQVSKAEGSPLERRLRQINISKSYLKKLKAEKGRSAELVEYAEKYLVHKEVEGTDNSTLPKEIPSGIVPRFGFALVSFRLIAWEPHKDTKSIADAMLAQETKRLEAEGAREEAFGKRDALKAVAEGESARFERLVKAMIAEGVDKNVAAQVVAMQVRMENVRDSKLTTYVEGGAGASIMVPTSSAPSAAPAPRT